MAVDNEQAVLSIRNATSFEQCWYNEARTRKPQTFVAADGAAAALDPTGGGGASCDFCQWPTLTAADSFGRVEGPHAVSASNLFKYCAPAQGLVLFKHHDPHAFDLPQLRDLLSVADTWFERAAAAEHGLHPGPLHPLFLWNCLGRAGASQFHGHAQVLLSHTPFPAPAGAAAAAERHAAAHPGGAGYYADLESAHEAAGLLRRRGGAAAFASLTPWKDSEVRVHGAGLGCPAFQAAFYAALRALLDERGVRAFNAAIYRTQPLLAGGASAAAAAAAAADGDGSGAAAAPAVVARISSRGNPSAKSSDFGGLEVYGHASIGHTDPYIVAAALDASLARLPSGDF